MVVRLLRESKAKLKWTKWLCKKVYTLNNSDFHKPRGPNNQLDTFYTAVQVTGHIFVAVVQQ